VVNRRESRTNNDVRSIGGDKTAADNPPLYGHWCRHVGRERRVSPPPRRCAASPIFLVICPILTVSMCAVPRGAPAAILVVPFPRVDTNSHIKGGCLRRFCRRRHFLRHYARHSFSFFWRPKSLAQSAQSNSHFRS